MKRMDNLAAIVTKRTYARPMPSGFKEEWPDIAERAIVGNVRGHNVNEYEVDRLRFFLGEQKATPAGRGLWFSGTEAHKEIGGVALNNCWFLTADKWENFVLAQDLLMLGGGVGLSVEHRFVSNLPPVKTGVTITHKKTNDADFIVSDKREGWNQLLYRVLEAYFVTGKGFTYSTICVRGKDEAIKGFGGKASGPGPLIEFIVKLCQLLETRAGQHIRPIDAADMICCTGEMVVSGNVRRSAIIIIGDCFDGEYLRAKRWDLKPIPTYRSCANYSVVCNGDIEDLHPSYWKTYEAGEAFGMVNRKNIQKFGRMGELKPDTAVGVNPCGEATLDSGEGCNLQELFLSRLNGIEEFVEGARLMHRWGKRVCLEKYHHAAIEDIIKKNCRIGTGITGCLQAPDLFTPDVLDHVYSEVQDENRHSSREYGLPESIRTTLVKPSGTRSIGLCTAGIHPDYAPYFLRRVRIAANDSLIPLLREAGYPIEPVIRFDGTLDPATLVVSFPRKAPKGCPTAQDFDTWQQLDTLLMVQRHWADQAVSVTVYYQREEIPKIKQWLADNLKNLKTISFLCRDDHGYIQAPLEAITKSDYDKLNAKVKRVDTSSIRDSTLLDDLECEGGTCPTR